MKAINRHSLGFREAMELRKKAIDAHLAEERSGERPELLVPVSKALLATIVVVALVAVLMYALGRADGLGDGELRAKTSEEQLLLCMNGRAVWTYQNNSKRGYGITVVRCQVAEEFPV